jgi:transcriptional regulator with XRE-family HTH domain
MKSKELEALLKESGETRTAFALRVGVTPRTVRRWLNGQHPIPQWLENILK